ncbi:MAG: hypothetical protein QM817_24230 [Archangium sp.]
MALVVVSSCAKQGVPPPQPLPPQFQRETTVRTQVPLKVALEEVSRDAHGAVLLVKIERLLAMDLPFGVEFQLPAGVTVKNGRTSYSVMPNTEANVVTERIELAWDEVPTEDAVLKVNGVTGVMGMHFKTEYRFGRPEPVVVAPSATGPVLKHRDRNFGPSIPLK